MNTTLKNFVAKASNTLSASLAFVDRQVDRLHFPSLHLPKFHRPHLGPHKVQRLKKFHAFAQLSYLATELGNIHIIHYGFTTIVLFGGVVFLILDEDVDGV